MIRTAGFPPTRQTLQLFHDRLTYGLPDLCCHATFGSAEDFSSDVVRCYPVYPGATLNHPV